jgi:hypothetical protein
MLNKALKQAKFILPGVVLLYVAYLLLKPALASTEAKIQSYSPVAK